MDKCSLSAYFDRIQWGGSTEPEYNTLSGLLAAHISHIPFENFDVLLQRPIMLDPSALQGKLIAARRGGYCFEHATLFASVLQALGFQPRRHAARVILFRLRAEAPRTHMFLSVMVSGVRYVVDPGFGPFGSSAPLEAEAAGATHRLLWQDGEWVLHVRREGREIPAWVSTLEDENPIDFEIANYFTATHPSSQFTNLIMASAVTPRGRVSIMNREVTTLTDGTLNTALLPDRRALRALVVQYFGFDLPEIENLHVPAIPEWR